MAPPAEMVVPAVIPFVAASVSPETAHLPAEWENRLLRIASPMFHFGMLLALGGHVGGLLIPEGWTEKVGISESAYHLMAVTLGAFAAPPGHWAEQSPRDEIRPTFSSDGDKLIITQDAREGLAAFNEKRKPTWTGR